jgi:hypothetical protein
MLSAIARALAAAATAADDAGAETGVTMGPGAAAAGRPLSGGDDAAIAAAATSGGTRGGVLCEVGRIGLASGVRSCCAIRRASAAGSSWFPAALLGLLGALGLALLLAFSCSARATARSTASLPPTSLTSSALLMPTRLTNRERARAYNDAPGRQQQHGTGRRPAGGAPTRRPHQTGTAPRPRPVASKGQSTARCVMSPDGLTADGKRHRLTQRQRSPRALFNRSRAAAREGLGQGFASALGETS